MILRFPLCLSMLYDCEPCSLRCDLCTQQVLPTAVVSISIKNDKLSAASLCREPHITLSLYRAGASYEDLSSEHLSGLSLVSQLAVVLLWFSFVFFILTHRQKTLK